MRSIRVKLILAVLLVVVPPILFLNRRTVEDFDTFTRRAQEEEMIGHARMLGEVYRMVSVADTADGSQERELLSLEAMMRSTGLEVQSHFRILDPQGRVLLDSTTVNPKPHSVAEHPEVQGAMKGRYGARTKLTPDHAYNFYHIALPIKGEDDRLVAIVTVSRHTGPILRAIIGMVERQRVALVGALIFAALIALALGQTMTSRLRRLTRTTRDYAGGRGPMDMKVPGRDEIAELGGAIRSMAAEIERRARGNRRIMSVLAHELRSPLAAIQGAVGALEAGAADSPKERERFLGNIRFEIERMLSMVGGLNSATRLESVAGAGRRVAVDAEKQARDVVERLTPTFPEQHAEIRIQGPDQPLQLNVVPAHFEQILGNLLDNAVRYTSSSGRIEIVIERSGVASVGFVVRDNGVGIAPEHLGRVFEPYFTTESREAAEDYGMGLGLWVVRSLLDLHHGSIRIESTVNEGTEVSFVLPTAR